MTRHKSISRFTLFLPLYFFLTAQSHTTISCPHNETCQLHFHNVKLSELALISAKLYMCDISHWPVEGESTCHSHPLFLSLTHKYFALVTWPPKKEVKLGGGGWVSWHFASICHHPILLSVRDNVRKWKLSSVIFCAFVLLSCLRMSTNGRSWLPFQTRNMSPSFPRWSLSLLILCKVYSHLMLTHWYTHTRSSSAPPGVKCL